MQGYDVPQKPLLLPSFTGNPIKKLTEPENSDEFNFINEKMKCMVRNRICGIKNHEYYYFYFVIFYEYGPTPMRHVICGVIIALIITLILSCSSQKNENFQYQYDMLSDLFSQVPEATQGIEFGDAPHQAYHLLQGWSGIEKELRWTEAKTATIWFFHHDVRKNKNVAITWAALPSSEGKNQDVKVLLNGKQVKSLTVKPFFTTDTFRFPVSALHPGFNLVTFQFSYTGKPLNIDPKSQDDRELAVAFKGIQFLDESASQKAIVRPEKPQGFWQMANSGISVFRKLPASFELDVEYQSSKGTKASLEIVNEQGETHTLRLPDGKRHASKTFSFPQERFYRINTSSTGPKDGYIVWNKVRLKTKSPQEDLNRNAQGFIKPSTLAAKRPDILLYVIDTLRADHVGCYGYSRNTTPHIDAFAQENARYQHAYSTSSWTKPSAASMLTGLLPRNHRTMTRKERLPDEVVTLSEILQAHGYYTVAFSTNSVVSRLFGFAQGYDEFVSFKEDHDSLAIHTPSATVNEHIFNFLQEYAARKERKPLFILVWTTDPHAPYVPPKNVQKLFDIDQYTPMDTSINLLTKIREQTLVPTVSQIEYMKTRYDQEIFANDRSFGRLLESLKNLGLYQNMTIMLTADHGEEFFEHHGVGHGFTLYNEQIRVPFIIKTPDIKPGVYNDVVALMDIYPTLLDMLDVAESYPLDGISMLTPGTRHDMLYFEETLGGNAVFARLDSAKKIIFNRRYYRPPLTQISIPVFEAYTAEDRGENLNLTIQGFEDFSRVQELISYMNDKNVLGIQEEEIEISPELDQKLRELGYAH